MHFNRNIIYSEMLRSSVTAKSEQLCRNNSINVAAEFGTQHPKYNYAIKIIQIKHHNVIKQFFDTN